MTSFDALPDQRNWAGNYRYAFRQLLRPQSHDELRRLVAQATSLRAIGSRHSFNAMADADAVISVDGLPPQIAISDDRRTATVSAGLTYGDLAVGLADHGLAVHNLASLPHISIGGAIASATHGSGDGNGNLATAVCAIELVTASGDPITFRRGDPPFDGAVVHLGALGVVSRVSLDVEPAFSVAQRVYEGLEWDALIENFDAITGSGYSVSVFTDWGGRTARVWVKARGGDAFPAELFGAKRSTVERHPIPGLDPVHCTPQLGVPGPWSERLPHFRMGFTPSSGEEIQSEFHLPRPHAGAALRALIGVGAAIRDVLQISEIRTIRADDLWMSPQHGRDTVSVHFTWRRDQAGVERALDHVQGALRPFDPRPHWGKVFLDVEAPVGRRYARLQDFIALKDRVDPDGKFTNDWLRRHVVGA
jgi:alditol oxidase